MMGGLKWLKMKIGFDPDFAKNQTPQKTHEGFHMGLA